MNTLSNKIDEKNISIEDVTRAYDEMFDNISNLDANINDIEITSNLLDFTLDKMEEEKENTDKEFIFFMNILYKLNNDFKNISKNLNKYSNAIFKNYIVIKEFNKCLLDMYKTDK